MRTDVEFGEGVHWAGEIGLTLEWSWILTIGMSELFRHNYMLCLKYKSGWVTLTVKTCVLS